MSAWQSEIPVTLNLTAEHQTMLMKHLFPGDGKETAAIALCTRRAGDLRHRLLVKEIHGIPYDVCTVRNSMRVSWPTEYIEPWLEMAAEQGLSIIKIHSHPNGLAEFSKVDDEGDLRFLPNVRGWIEHDIPHGSIIVLPDGEIVGRVISQKNTFAPITTISIVGSDLSFFHPMDMRDQIPEFTSSHTQAFGSGTTQILRNLVIAVIGCSGTGSLVIEQLARLGIGTLIIVDDDIIEERNLNRIPQATLKDAKHNRFKADVIAKSIGKSGLDVEVIPVTKNLWTPEVVRLVAQSDVLFGCMDSVDGRYLLNSIASCYLLPYFDIGVRLDAVPDGIDKGKIREVCGTVNYLQPGKSSLLSRGLISMQQVAAAGLHRKDPAAYQQQIKDGYIRGIQERRPAVISVNMYFAALAINDFLARLHPYREMLNKDIASIGGSLASLELFPDPETEVCKVFSQLVGRGDVFPLLDLPELSEEKTNE